MFFRFDQYAPTGKNWFWIEIRRKSVDDPWENAKVWFEFDDEFLQETTYGCIRITGLTFYVVFNREQYLLAPGASTWRILKGRNNLVIAIRRKAKALKRWIRS